MKPKIIYLSMALVLLVLCLVFAGYYRSSQDLIKGLSDNQTILTKNINTVYTEYVKLAQPKGFASEKDLVTWLDSNKDNPTLVGYMTLAKQQGAFMQVWAGWKYNNSTISGIDFGADWQKSKDASSGTKYALMTIVGKQNYIIDLETKRLIPIESTATNGTSWGK